MPPKSQSRRARSVAKRTRSGRAVVPNRKYQTESVPTSPAKKRKRSGSTNKSVPSKFAAIRKSIRERSHRVQKSVPAEVAEYFGAAEPYTANAEGVVRAIDSRDLIPGLEDILLDQEELPAGITLEDLFGSRSSSSQKKKKSSERREMELPAGIRDEDVMEERIENPFRPSTGSKAVRAGLDLRELQNAARDVQPRGKRPAKKHNEVKKTKSKIVVAIEKRLDNEEMMIPAAPFRRLVREISDRHLIGNSEPRWMASAVKALQEGAEDYLIGVFEDAKFCTAHAKRVTTFPKDVQLARFISEGRQ